MRFFFQKVAIGAMSLLLVILLNTPIDFNQTTTQDISNTTSPFHLSTLSDSTNKVRQASAYAQDISILTIDHTVEHITTVPGFEGNLYELSLRERIISSLAEQPDWDAEGKVVLMVHGFSVPGTVVFDLNYEEYSWLAYLAAENYDAFSLDLTGYGASTRPAPMDNLCNLNSSDQYAIGIAECDAEYPHTLTNLQSDWDDINAAVDYIRELRGVEQISLVGVSWGGPRVLGYAAEYPEKVDKLIVHGSSGAFSLKPPPSEPVPGYPMSISTQESFRQRWEPMLQCPDQVDPEIDEMIWPAIVSTDSLGATQEPSFIRFPSFPLAGFTRKQVESIQLPVLVVGGEFDTLASPYWVRRLYDAFLTPNRIYATLDCTSHFISFETRSIYLYQLSLDWLENNTVSGKTQGILTIKDDGTYEWQEDESI